MSTAWCRRRSRSAVATAELDLAQSEKPRFEVMTIFLTARVDELKEQVVAARSEREVADFSNDEQRKAAAIADASRRAHVPVVNGRKGRLLLCPEVMAGCSDGHCCPSSPSRTYRGALGNTMGVSND
jgi:hypothetical protein